MNYPQETLEPDDDNGTMPENMAELAEAVVGHRITGVERSKVKPRYEWEGRASAVTLTLDDGRKVHLADTDDCCAYTQVEDIILNLDKIDHVITGVGTTDGYTVWHIYADLGDVMEMKVGWSCGNPFYYGYGFNITITGGTP